MPTSQKNYAYFDANFDKNVVIANSQSFDKLESKLLNSNSSINHQKHLKADYSEIDKLRKNLLNFNHRTSHFENKLNPFVSLFQTQSTLFQNENIKKYTD